MNREPDAPSGYELVLHFNTERDAEAFKAAFENLLDTAAKQWNSKTLLPAGSPLIRPVWGPKHDEQPSPLAVTAIAGARFDPPEVRIISACRNACGEVYFRGIPLTDDHVFAVLSKVADLVNSTWVHASSKDLDIKITRPTSRIGESPNADDRELALRTTNLVRTVLEIELKARGYQVR